MPRPVSRTVEPDPAVSVDAADRDPATGRACGAGRWRRGSRGPRGSGPGRCRGSAGRRRSASSASTPAASARGSNERTHIRRSAASGSVGSRWRASVPASDRASVRRSSMSRSSTRVSSRIGAEMRRVRRVDAVEIASRLPGIDGQRRPELVADVGEQRSGAGARRSRAGRPSCRSRAASCPDGGAGRAAPVRRGRRSRRPRPRRSPRPARSSGAADAAEPARRPRRGRDDDDQDDDRRPSGPRCEQDDPVAATSEPTTMRKRSRERGSRSRVGAAQRRGRDTPAAAHRLADRAPSAAAPANRAGLGGRRSRAVAGISRPARDRRRSGSRRRRRSGRSAAGAGRARACGAGS